MMKTKGLKYSDNEVKKMVYYFQNRSLIRIIWEWIKLKFKKKAKLSDIQKR